MGIRRETGYSATVESYLVIGDKQIRIAKTNHRELFLAESCEVAPRTTGNLVIIVDDDEQTNTVSLPDGVVDGQTVVAYTTVAPF
jgi:hypothetical protein